MKGLKKNWAIRKVKNECDLDDVIVTLSLVFERWNVLLWYSDSYKIDELIRYMLKLIILMVCKK